MIIFDVIEIIKNHNWLNEIVSNQSSLIEQTS